jgi:hypothetical protein
MTDILTDLARARAAFQCRTLEAILTEGKPTFHCPDYPVCGCPDGAVHPNCPGLNKGDPK